MKSIVRWVGTALFLQGVVMSPPAAAQAYVGAEVGHEKIAFKPTYRFVDGSADQAFHNQAAGTSFGLAAGYRWKTAEGFSLDLHGRMSASHNQWTLSLPEPATFRYDLPLSVSLSLAPAFQVNERLALFAEAGLALGRIREQKQSPTASRYDIQTWQPGGLVGLGARWALDERWTLRLAHHRVGYRSHGFDTFDAGGRQVESVRSRVTQGVTTLALVRTL